ncbi:MAG: c-type cytochrome [Thermoguttaceae bacterium]|jgi:YVTN family beta-propeller protein|nr:c-type cytochrome [Thermoguttaceae bacterium]
MFRSVSVFSRVSLLSLVACILTVAGSPLAACAAEWLGPSAVTASADGKHLFVACRDASQVLVVDAASGEAAGQIPMPASPTSMALSPDGKTLYVTCAAPKSTVAVIDIEKKAVADSIPAGHTATGIAVTPDGNKLYVCNRFNNEVAVIDRASKEVVARVPVIREPHGAVITPDGATVFVINHLPLNPADSFDVAAEVAVINTADNAVRHIRLPNGSTHVRGIAISPDGKYVYVPHILSRYQMPTTQLERGWMNTNALSIIDAVEKKHVNTVLLDDVDLGAANPWGVTTNGDGSLICVTHAGTQELSVIDAKALMEKLAGIPVEPEPGQTPDRSIYASVRQADVPNDLAFLVGLRRRIKLQGNGAHGVAVIGNKAFVAMYFTDNLSAVDLEDRPGRLVNSVALGPEPQMTIQRRGQMLFNDADLCFQNWQSCGSCHPDARVDSLNWDLLNDGIGNPKNTKSMLLAHQTPPSMALGVRANAEEGVRAGITHIQFAVRPEEDAVAIDEFLKAMAPVPSPYLVDGKLSPAAERGKKIFFDETVGCARCHPEPLYTDNLFHDVGSRGQYSRADAFVTPTLVEIWRTAPYMHDGKWLTIEDLIKKGKHGAKGGDISKLTEEQINDLVEFVLSL